MVLRDFCQKNKISRCRWPNFCSFAQNPTNSATVPTTGWNYYAVNGEWKEDPDMTVTPVTSLTDHCCSAVTISAMGRAGREQTNKLGTFTPTGDYSSGRQVFRNTISGQYLLVPADHLNWYVLDDVNAHGSDNVGPGNPLGEGIQSFQSGCAPGLCPAHPRASYNSRPGGGKAWQYKHGNLWYDSTEISVTCTTHKFSFDIQPYRPSDFKKPWWK